MKSIMIIICVIMSLFVNTFCFAKDLNLKIYKEIEVTFDDFGGVYPESTYQQDIKYDFKFKNFDMITATVDFGGYIRQVPFDDYLAFNQTIRYEFFVDKNESKLVFRRTFINGTGDSWDITAAVRNFKIALYRK